MQKTNSESRPSRMRAAVLGAIGAAALLLVPSMASAGPFGHGKRGFGRGGKRGGGMGKLMRGNLKRLSKMLKLTPSQVKQIKRLRAQNITTI